MVLKQLIPFMLLAGCVDTHSHHMVESVSAKQTTFTVQDNTMQPMYLSGLCMSRSRIQEWVGQTGEVRLATGFGFVEEATTGTFPQGILSVWVNPDTWSYSISIEFADGVNCLLSQGQDFQPARVQPAGEPL